jgi:serine protease Do
VVLFLVDCMIRFTSLLLLIVAPLLAASDSGLAKLDFRDVVRRAKDKVFPAVVFIKCLRESHELGKKQSQEVAGSGMLISEKGEILTNWHVVDKAIEVRCLLYDGRAFDAKVAGSDKDLDIALVRLDLSKRDGKLPYAKLGDSDALREGDFVMAMGAPWGLARSVSIGIVSCTRRYLVGSSEYSLWLQTDAAISPGNSGGPLIDTDGRIVGITTLGVILGGDMGFALPSSTIREILPRLRQHGDVEWAWTGLRLQPLRDFQRNVYFEGDKGVIVAGLDEYCPAKEAGIRERDRILTIGGVEVNGVTDEDLPEIRRRIGLLPFGKSVEVGLRRGRKRKKLTLTPRRKGKVEGDELDCPRWDMTVKTINQFENPDLYFHRKQGVFVYGVEYPGNAADARLAEKDILLEIDHEPVKTLRDVEEVYSRVTSDIATASRVLLTVLRNGLLWQVVLDFSRDYERE